MRLLALLLTGCTCGQQVTSALQTWDEARDELKVNVESIRNAEIELLVVDDFRACSDRAAAQADSSATPREWQSSKCWLKIGWEPDAPVRGGYWVEVSEDGEDFTVYGVMDADGDGTFAEVKATRHTEAERVTGDDVY